MSLHHFSFAYHYYHMVSDIIYQLLAIIVVIIRYQICGKSFGSSVSQNLCDLEGHQIQVI